MNNQQNNTNVTKDYVVEKNITDTALNTINKYLNDGVLVSPKNYSVENAMKSAYLTLVNTKDKNDKPVLETCTRESIYQALLDMAIQGLTPAKNQCYFIAYGNKLTLSRSYMGTIAVAKNLVPEIKDVKGYCLYDGDEFETEFDYKTGCFKVTKFNPSFDNINDKKIKGAFAMIIGNDGVLHTEIMNMTQIKNAWDMGQMKGNSKAHNKFTDQMAIRTVINRACKLYINTSDDSSMLFSESYYNSDEDNKSEQEIKAIDGQIFEEIEDNANSQFIDIEFEEVEEAKQAVKPTKKENKEPVQKSFMDIQAEDIKPITEEDVPF